MVIPEIPEIPEENIDNIIDGDEFNDLAIDFKKSFEDGNQTAYIENAAIEQFYKGLEADGESMMNVLITSMLKSVGITILSDVPNKAINSALGSFEIADDSVSLETMENVLNDQPILEEDIKTMRKEAEDAGGQIEETIGDMQPGQRSSTLAMDQLARDGVENAASRDPPLEGTWNDVFKKLAKWLIDNFLKLGLFIGSGLFILKLLAKAMTGCYQYYDKTKVVKLVCSEYNYGKDQNKVYCTCLTSDQVGGCTGSEPLISLSTTTEDLKNVCDQTTGGTCLNKPEFAYNPICTLSEGSCMNARPMVCNRTDLSVYYSYQMWDWASLLGNLLANWPNLFKPPVNALEKLITYTIFGVVSLFAVVIVYWVSKLVIKRLNYRVDNAQMKRLQQRKNK